VRAGARASKLAAAAETPTLQLALDFDGVLCDSVGESSETGWKCALSLWPDIFGPAESERERVIEEMRLVRPVVETGYENLLLVRVLLERSHTVEELLADWPGILPQCMEKWGLERAPMVEFFGRVRDEWIESDLQGWLAPNRFYDGIPSALNTALDSPSTDVQIVTTKQARFTYQLLSDMAGVPVPMERIFSTTVSGEPKTVVLRQLLAAAPDEGVRRVFVEDKISTLEKVCGEPDLADWELLLVDWGYNTPAERARAEANPRISVVSLDYFNALLAS